MDIVLQQIVNAISLGGIYALLALGLAVIFSIISLINFAHGELMTVAGYGMFFAAAVSLPFPFAVCAAWCSCVQRQSINSPACMSTNLRSAAKCSRSFNSSMNMRSTARLACSYLQFSRTER